MITRGTTPYHVFTIPLSSDKLSKVYITYMQNDEVILDKTIEDITIEPVVQDENDEAAATDITIHLTQEDTLKFHFYPAAEKNIAVIQIRVLTTEGEAYASHPIHRRIFGVLKDGII